MSDKINTIKEDVICYAKDRQLENTIKAAGYVERCLEKLCGSDAQVARRDNARSHIYEVCELIIDLNPAITTDEMDTLLSSVLLHILPERWPVEDLHYKIVSDLGYSEDIYTIVNLLALPSDLTHEEQKEICETIQSNRLALIAALAERGNVIQTIYQHSTWVAHRYISESKAYYMPMAIYGKEHYRDLVGVIAILMEKLRTLLEVAEIFLSRFEAREAELTQDILALHEENATIRGIITDFRASN